MSFKRLWNSPTLWRPALTICTQKRLSSSH